MNARGWLVRAAAVPFVIWGAGGVRRARRTMQLAALDAAVARHPGGSKLAGPGKPQASGVSRHDETGIGEWTDAELAFLRGHRETPDE